MNSKKKVLIGLIFCAIAGVALTYVYLAVERTKVLEAYHKDTALARLQRIDSSISLFLNHYIEEVTKLAVSQDLLATENYFPNYLKYSYATARSAWQEGQHSEPVQKVLKSWAALFQKDPYVNDVFVAFESGASYSAQASEFLESFFGSTRPWYTSAKMKNAAMSLGTAYMSLTGETVIPSQVPPAKLGV